MEVLGALDEAISILCKKSNKFCTNLFLSVQKLLLGLVVDAAAFSSVDKATAACYGTDG